MLQTLLNFLRDSGFGHLSIPSMVMICVGLLFIWLAIKKGFEPLLLVPIGFGILLGNIPYNAQKLAVGVYDGPVSEEKLEYFVGEDAITLENGTLAGPWTQLIVYPRSDEERAKLDANEVIMVNHSEIKDLTFSHKVIMVHSEEFLSYHGEFAPGVKEIQGGHHVYVPDVSESEKPENERYKVVITSKQQDAWGASVFWFLFRGIEWGIYPPLIFLGVGALTDFGPLLSNPRTILLGAAAQFGIFGALVCSLFLGFTLKEAGSIGIIGGADGPTAIFTCSQLAPHLLGAVALAAYSYMAMVPIIQPPIMKLLTTKKERLIRMEAPKNVSKTVKVIFPVAGFLLTAFIANGALPLLGLLFFGNLLRECMVTDRLAKTAQTTLIDIVTILLGLTVGMKTQASTFLTTETIGIFVLGVGAFCIATATGLLAAKLMNLVCKDKINPLIGAAGVSAVPMAARVVQTVAHKEDPQNFLLMHAMGPNVAGVIGSAVAAGVLLSYLG